jgi:hypothetical protein
MTHIQFSRSRWQILIVQWLGLSLAMRKARMKEVQAHMNLLSIHILRLKGNDLLAQRMRIMYQKKRYTSIRN